MIDPSTPILPVWFVAPMAVVTMLILATHVTSVQSSDMPRSRQRIRVANGILMMFLTPLVAFVFGFATTDEPGLFVMGWTSVSAMLVMVLMLAGLDMLNTARLHRQELRRIRREAMTESSLAGLSEEARARLQVSGVYDAGHDG